MSDDEERRREAAARRQAAEGEWKASMPPVVGRSGVPTRAVCDAAEVRHVVDDANAWLYQGRVERDRALRMWADAESRVKKLQGAIDAMRDVLAGVP